MWERKNTGRKGGHKGRVRQYTSPEEIDAQIKAEHEKALEAELEEGGVGGAEDPTKAKKDQSSDESEDDDDYQQKRKGVEGLIDIENPNRAAQASKKVTQVDLEGPRELSRREKEEIEKQKAKERYMKLHLAGKTDQAKADLAVWQSSENRGKRQQRRRRKKKKHGNQGKHRVTKRGPALSYPMFTLVTSEDIAGSVSHTPIQRCQQESRIPNQVWMKDHHIDEIKFWTLFSDQRSPSRGLIVGRCHT
ncbi:unnamed protein product [Ranitomeya imitator]|uniref:Casein kinase substrate phosphoprotein PP28 domain-containing protein n=1 Tax=Ranitomeya imitator TaxID=111125 RepID=A0ABN9LXU9_9NEOB|nr:unnamed protein product [Ranitomeya imitator]